MLIKCLLKRDGGSKIDLGEKEYHFAPNEQGDHLAEITNKDHIKTLLAIPEAYVEVKKSGKQPDTTNDAGSDKSPENADQDPDANLIKGNADENQDQAPKENDQGGDETENADQGAENASGNPEATALDAEKAASPAKKAK